MVSWVKAHLNTLWPNTFGPKSPSESLKIFDDMDPMTWISLLVVLPPVVTGNTYVTRRRTAFVWFPVAYSVWTRTTSERQLCTYEKEIEKWFVCNWTKKGANGSSRGCFGCPHTLLRMGTIDGEGDKAGGHYYRFIGTCLYISLYTFASSSFCTFSPSNDITPRDSRVPLQRTLPHRPCFLIMNHHPLDEASTILYWTFFFQITLDDTTYLCYDAHSALVGATQFFSSLVSLFYMRLYQRLNCFLAIVCSGQILEQEKHVLRRKVDAVEGEYESKVSELQSDVADLRRSLEEQQNNVKIAERQKSSIITQLTEQNQRLTAQLKEVSPASQFYTVTSRYILRRRSFSTKPVTTLRLTGSLNTGVRISSFFPCDDVSAAQLFFTKGRWGDWFRPLPEMTMWMNSYWLLTGGHRRRYRHCIIYAQLLVSFSLFLQQHLLLFLKVVGGATVSCLLIQMRNDLFCFVLFWNALGDEKWGAIECPAARLAWSIQFEEI